MRKITAIIWVGMKQMASDPVQIMFIIALPVLMTWIMSFLPVEGGVYEMATLGVLVMFVALNIITSAGGYILEEKQTGTWSRMLAGTVTFWQIMAAYFTRIFVVAFIQSMVLILSGKFLFGAPWNYGYFEVMVVLIVYIFAMTGLGLFLAGFLKTQGQVQAVAMAVVMMGTMLGGVFVPIENPPAIVRFIASVSPQSWAAHSLKDLFTNGASLSSLTPSITLMTGAGLLLLAAGVFKLQLEN